ncbi:hypothetical protein TNCV_5117121 [Trichonephila clavipes]|nr:hypothetical protein TNCV_5117121 [Trichonephila clavipes]
MHSAFVAEGYSKQTSSRKSSRVVGGRRREMGGPWPPPGFSPSKLGGTEQIRTATCMCSKAKANDKPLATMNFVGLDLTSSGRH